MEHANFLQTCSVLSVCFSQISMIYKNWEKAEGMKKKQKEEEKERRKVKDYLLVKLGEGNLCHKFLVNACVDGKWRTQHCFNDTAGDLLSPGLNRKLVVQKNGCPNNGQPSVGKRSICFCAE